MRAGSSKPFPSDLRKMDPPLLLLLTGLKFVLLLKVRLALLSSSIHILQRKTKGLFQAASHGFRKHQLQGNWHGCLDMVFDYRSFSRYVRCDEASTPSESMPPESLALLKRRSCDCFNGIAAMN